MDIKGVSRLIQENKDLRIGHDLRGAKLRLLRRFINSDKKYSNYNRKNLVLYLGKIKDVCNSMEGAGIEAIATLHHCYLGYEDNITEKIIERERG